MKHITELEQDNKQLKKEKRELKKEVKALKVKSETQKLYIDVTEGYIPPEFYSAVAERYAKLTKHLKVVYGAYIILAISTLMMIINFYLR